jgi:hypothetical protein
MISIWFYSVVFTRTPYFPIFRCSDVKHVIRMWNMKSLVVLLFLAVFFQLSIQGNPSLYSLNFQVEIVIYDDSLQNGWQTVPASNFVTITPNSANTVFNGTFSILVNAAGT